jgi:hypothetical protein
VFNQFKEYASSLSNHHHMSRVECLWNLSWCSPTKDGFITSATRHPVQGYRLTTAYSNGTIALWSESLLSLPSFPSKLSLSFACTPQQGPASGRRTVCELEPTL